MIVTKPYNHVLIRYAELSLKSGNRGNFEKQLVKNIAGKLPEESIKMIQRVDGGIRIQLADGVDDKTVSRLEKVAGIAWFAPSWTCERNTTDVFKVIREGLNEQLKKAKTFAVDSQRSDKGFPITSVDMNIEIGALIQEQYDIEVDLDNPEFKVEIHILSDSIEVFSRRYEGLRGLPVKTTGKGLSLLSGGIDSPVSSIEIMKRGMQVDFLHFYAYPTAEDALEAGMQNLVGKINQYNSDSTLFMVPYHPFELGTFNVSERVEMLLFRRHTMRVAETIASENGHQALITGENLGQVASQTVENIKSIASATDQIIFRPLISMTKNEIIKLAEKYDTYKYSIQNYRDCCSIQSKRPLTRSDSDQLLKIEEREELFAIDDQALAEMNEFKVTTCGRLEKMKGGVNV